MPTLTWRKLSCKNCTARNAWQNLQWHEPGAEIDDVCEWIWSRRCVATGCVIQNHRSTAIIRSQHRAYRNGRAVTVPRQTICSHTKQLRLGHVYMHPHKCCGLRHIFSEHGMAVHGTTAVVQSKSNPVDKHQKPLTSQQQLGHTFIHSAKARHIFLGTVVVL